MCKAEFEKAINKAVFPGIQGGPLEHIIAAKAVALKEAMSDEFVEYQRQVVKNAKKLAEVLTSRGINLVSGGTDNHLMLLDLTNNDITGKELEFLLDEAHITVNKNAIPFDSEKPMKTSGIRLGTAAMTTRGFKEKEFRQVALWIARVLKERENPESIKEEVLALTKNFPIDF